MAWPLLDTVALINVHWAMYKNSGHLRARATFYLVLTINRPYSLGTWHTIQVVHLILTLLIWDHLVLIYNERWSLGIYIFKIVFTWYLHKWTVFTGYMHKNGIHLVLYYEAVTCMGRCSFCTYIERARLLLPWDVIHWVPIWNGVLFVLQCPLDTYMQETVCLEIVIIKKFSPLPISKYAHAHFSWSVSVVSWLVQ